MTSHCLAVPTFAQTTPCWWKTSPLFAPQPAAEHANMFLARDNCFSYTWPDHPQRDGTHSLQSLSLLHWNAPSLMSVNGEHMGLQWTLLRTSKAQPLNITCISTVYLHHRLVFDHMNSSYVPFWEVEGRKAILKVELAVYFQDAILCFEPHT